MSDDGASEVGRMKQDARRWVAQLASGEATTTDAEALGRWRRQSAAHEAAYVEAVRLWRDLGPGSRAFVARQGMPAWSGQRDRLTRRAIFGGAGALAAAASVAYAVVSPPFELWPSLEEMRADYRTTTGEQRHVAIGEVAVQLNTRTSITVESGEGDIDRVRLITGEAAFAIPALSRRSLVVSAGRARVVASRARFDVLNLGETIRVTCLDGDVRVERGEQATTIGSGRQLGFDANGLEPARTVDAVEATSWQTGFIVFRYTPLSAAVAEINRYRPGKIVVLNTALGSKTVSGRFRIERIDEVLSWIERATGATSRALPGGLVLLS